MTKIEPRKVWLRGKYDRVSGPHNLIGETDQCWVTESDGGSIELPKREYAMEYEKVPRKVWLRANHGKVSERYLIGETSQSWVTESGGISTEWPKEEYEIVSEVEYEQYIWVVKNGRSIGSAVDGLWDYHLLKQIADLIGHKEE